MQKRNRNDKWLLLVPVLFGLVASLFWRPIQRELLASLTLRADTANETAVDEVASRSADPLRWIEQLWRSKKIPHRLLAVSYLRRNAPQNHPLIERAQSLLLTAARDGDFEVRKMALETLADHHHPEWVRLATEQLCDVDPAARELGLTLLRWNGNAGLVPVVIPLLDDAEPRVVHAAAATLRRWTGLDFGIRYKQIATALEDNKSKDSETENLEAFARGVNRWKEWWERQQAEYPLLPSSPADRSPSAWGLPAPDCRLADLYGKTVRLEEFRGKAALLYFWSSAVPETLRDIPALVEFQRRNAERLVVLGISLDGAGFDKCCDGDAHLHTHENETDRGEICARLETFVANREINFRVLLDPKADAAARFHVSELPTCVLVDSEGRVRRRFAGGRRLEVLTAMLNEIAASKTASQPTPAAGAKDGKP